MSTTLLPTILIVDDSQATRAMVKRILAMLDLPIGPVYEAGDGAEGLAAMRTVRVDLVLADLNMPVMDGFEMIAQMRQDSALLPIPVVVVSAQPDPQQVLLLKQQGVMGYLPKPFTPEAVRQLIAPILERAGQSESARAIAAPPGSFNHCLAEALAEALQTIAFISPQLIEGQSPLPLAAGTRVVRVDFQGKDTRGWLALAAPAALGEAMADNLQLGAAAGADDALKELANVTCGLLLRMRPGGGAGFHLTPPRISTPEQADSDSLLHAREVITLEADGDLITAHITVTTPASV